MIINVPLILILLLIMCSCHTLQSSKEKNISQDIHLSKLGPDKIGDRVFLSSDRFFIVKVIGKMDHGHAESFIKNKQVQIRELFQNYFDPYGGNIQKSQECLQGNKTDDVLRVDNQGMYWSASLWATPLLVYGICDANQNIYQSLLTLKYCESNKTMYDVRMFYPIAEVATPTALSCL